MFKTLLSKQLSELVSGFIRNQKTGKQRSTAGIVGFTLLYIFVFFTLAFMFFSVSAAICPILTEAELDWLFFGLMGTIAMLFGIFGSIFTTYNCLYEAKDNDLLLSMPIKPSVILLSRTSAVYIMAFVFEFVVLIPSMIAYPIFGGRYILSATLGILFSVILMPLFTVGISSILGWIIAIIASKLKRKSIITVIISIAFFGLYYYFIGNSDKLIEDFANNSASIAGKFRSALFFMYFFGKGCAGDILLYGAFALISVAVFAVVYYVLSVSFIKLATTKRSGAKVKYEKKEMKAGSQGKALLSKEISRLSHSSVYMLNCGLGIVFCILIACVCIIKAGQIGEIIAEIPEIVPFLPLVGALAVTVGASMNDITAPSVSLEGKNLWILKTLPVDVKEIMKAKIMLHFIFTAVPATVLSVVIDAVIRPDIVSMIGIPLIGISYSIFTGVTGLWIGLLMPNLNWTNEAVPVKQGVGVLLSMLLNLFSSFIIVGIGVVISIFVTPYLAFPVMIVILLGVSYFVWYWIKTGGVRIFTKL